MSDIFEQLRDVLVERFDVPVEAITLGATLDELGVDSVSTVEVTDVMGEMLGIEPTDDDQLSSASTVEQVCQVLHRAAITS